MCVSSIDAANGIDARLNTGLYFMAVKTKKSSGQMSLFGESEPEKKIKKKAKPANKKTETRPKAVERTRPSAEKKLKVAPLVKKKHSKTKAATAESMAAKQRDISVSEFFAKNRHLLGFDNPRKALLTAVKEAVDNSFDACEEAHILPDISITIKPVENKENLFTLNVTDNGPGILKEQIPNIFARLLYGSKFHTLKMSRGQQGIGISAAGMYGLITTGEPVQIISRTSPKKPALHYHVQIDTSRNKPEVILDEQCEFDLSHGTSVTITLEGRYQKGRQSVDEYIAQTAIANPHSKIIYNAPDGKTYEYPRETKELPFMPVEIKPHPYGVELGMLYKMARDSSSKTLSEFLRKSFSRVSPALAAKIVKTAKLSSRLKPKKIVLQEAEALHKAVNKTKIMSPPTDCIGPIGEDNLIGGLKRVVDAVFYSSCTRRPSVYRGNPFLIEAALAYGFKESDSKNSDDSDKEPLMRLSRIANRVPLLYQQSACAIYKSVLEVNWRNYGLAQSRGALPRGHLMLMVHIASVWVPFTSESKEAIAHYPEIIKDIKLAVQECGRKLGIYVKRQKRIKQEMIKQDYIKTYLPPIGEALRDILALKEKQVGVVVDRLKDTLEKSRKL
jgi:DNA topoisomerase VI subunit B